MIVRLEYGAEVDIDLDDLFSEISDKYLVEELVRRGIDLIPLITKDEKLSIIQAKEIEEFLSKYDFNGRSLLQQM